MIHIAKLAMAVIALGLVLAASSAHAQEKPNILVVWGDDVGNTNISANAHGLM